MAAPAREGATAAPAPRRAMDADATSVERRVMREPVRGRLVRRGYPVRAAARTPIGRAAPRGARRRSRAIRMVDRPPPAEVTPPGDPDGSVGRGRRGGRHRSGRGAPPPPDRPPG